MTEEADPETSSGVSAEQELEEQTENPEQSEAVPQYDFDEVIEEEQREEEQKQIYFIQKALIEMEMLLKPQYCNKVKLFQEYFRKAEYQEILKQPVYMGMFAELLESSRLKPVIYDHIIDYYRFRGLNPEDMYEGAAKLYRVLDEKRGMKKKKTGTLQTVILVGAVAGVRAGTRSVSSDSGAGKLFGFLAVLVIVIALMFLLYRQLYKNHSGLFAQAITAVLLTVSQFIVLMGDFYAPLMGTDAGAGLAVILFLLGGVWIIGVGIAAVVKKLLFLKK